MKRAKRGSILIAICTVLVILVALVIQQSTQAQRPGEQSGRSGRPGGRFNVGSMIMGPLEKSWAYVSFELKLADPVLVKARRIYQKYWDERKILTEKMKDATGDRQAMQRIRAEAEELKADRYEKLKDVMLPVKLDKLIKWEQETQQQTQRRGPR